MHAYCFAFEDAVQPPSVSFYNRSLQEDLRTQPDEKKPPNKRKDTKKDKQLSKYHFVYTIVVEIVTSIWLTNILLRTV